MSQLHLLKKNANYHKPLYVQPGKLLLALEFFREIGWREVSAGETVPESSRQTRYLQSGLTNPVHMIFEPTRTWETQGWQELCDSTDLIICFYDLRPVEVAPIIRAWAVENGVATNMHQIDSSKGSVKLLIPAIFGFSITIC